MQCSRDVENQNKVSACTRMRGCSSAPATNKSKKITFILGLELNFAVNVDF